ncbi:glutathione S-transferase [Clavulina sp. PMI_390]|nr:glutathione S-transferase [Clavulina sp. PMI_390]
MTPPFTLYTVGSRWSPNAFKAGLIFAELQAAYPKNPDIDYLARIVDLRQSSQEQKKEWYLKINPNGRIPTLVHHRPDGTDFTVTETAAIILYLAQQFDKEHKLSFPRGSDEENQALQMMFFAHGDISPIQGEAMHFVAEPEPPALTPRWVDETKRTYGVLNTRLEGRDYLVGPGKGMYSVADINVFPYVRLYDQAGIESLAEYPNLKRWLDNVSARPAVQVAAASPSAAQRGLGNV